MNTKQVRPVNPRIRARTAQYVAQKRRQGERWSALHANAMREVDRLWLNPDAAWRRWQADPAER